MQVHEWIRTSDICAGLSGSFFDTEVADHQSMIVDEVYPGYTCEVVSMVDEQCVTDRLTSDLGSHRGTWGPTNSCWTYVSDVLNECFSLNVCTDEGDGIGYGYP